MAGPRRESEIMVAASALDWTIVRPPAVFGPGDREMLELFRAAQARHRAAAARRPPVGDRGAGSGAPAARDPARRRRQPRRDLRARRRQARRLDAHANSHRRSAMRSAAACGPSRCPPGRCAPAPSSIRCCAARMPSSRPIGSRYFLPPQLGGEPRFRPPAHLWRPQLATVDALAIAAEATARKAC